MYIGFKFTIYLKSEFKVNFSLIFCYKFKSKTNPRAFVFVEQFRGNFSRKET